MPLKNFSEQEIDQYIGRCDLDMNHNSSPFLTCEGECREHGEVFTAHRLKSELYDPEKEEYTQHYSCTICRVCRKFGATNARVTRGESN